MQNIPEDDYVRPEYIVRQGNNEAESGAAPVTGRGGLQGCEMLRISHCLENRPTDVGVVFSLRAGRALIPQNIS
jgi:hypothetical protein